MCSSAVALLILSILCSQQKTATTQSIVTNTLVEYPNVACPPWITILYTVISRSKIACAALGLQNIFCQTVQYNGQNNECMLIADRISTNMNFVSNPNLFIINLNRDPCIGTQTITFDDIPNISPTGNVIPSSYACFNWINGGYVNATTNATNNTGYQTVLTSGQYVGLNAYGLNLTMSLTNRSFNLISFWASAAYFDGLQISISGSQNNMLINNAIVTVYTYIRSSIQLNWTTIDTVVFKSIPSLGLGYQFTMDNLVVTFS